MNCIVHNQESAVSTCTNCNVGLCSVCIKEAFKIDNKALCKECTLSFFDSNLQELQQLLESIRTKKNYMDYYSCFWDYCGYSFAT